MSDIEIDTPFELLDEGEGVDDCEEISKQELMDKQEELDSLLDKIPE